MHFLLKSSVLNSELNLIEINKKNNLKKLIHVYNFFTQYIIFICFEYSILNVKENLKKSLALNIYNGKYILTNNLN